ncbi:MAG: hypothetical protein HW421_1030 [Ignavibacteria bacterium]|nr:hypothetical protein [Ignavibacteria bacterium]
MDEIITSEIKPETMQRIPFSEEEVKIMLRLARWMRFIGSFMIGVVLIILCVGIFMLVRSQDPITKLPTGLVFIHTLNSIILIFVFVMGVLLWGAAKKFVLVAKTDIDDQVNLVGAFRRLKNYFMLTGILILLYIICVIVIVLMLLAYYSAAN